MFNIGDYVVYKKEVCRILDYREKLIGEKDYYSLIPVMDTSLKIDVPVDSGFIRSVIDADTVNGIIDNIVNISPIESDDRMIENIYKDLLHEGSYESLIRIIKTTYLRNNERINNKRKISEKDNNYFNLAEKYLYSEFAIALGMDYDGVKSYIIDRIDNKSNKWWDLLLY